MGHTHWVGWGRGRPTMPKSRQVDELCDRFNVTAVIPSQTRARTLAGTCSASLWGNAEQVPDTAVEGAHQTARARSRVLNHGRQGDSA